MIAARKTLWRTPDAVMDAAVEALQVSEKDVVYEVGCADGKFLVKCAERGARCVGVEILEERVAQAQQLAEEKKVADKIEVICGNALQLDYSQATVVFFYLDSRGIRKVPPIVRAYHRKQGSNIAPPPLRVGSYMMPIPEQVPSRVLKATCTHGPLYIYDPLPRTAVQDDEKQKDGLEATAAPGGAPTAPQCQTEEQN